MLKRLVGLLIPLVLCGCGISVTPLATNDTKLVDPETISVNKDGIYLAAKVVDVEIPPYRAEKNIASIYVNIKNNTDRNFIYSLKSFLLIDSTGKQYFPIPTDRLTGYFERELSYLIPYPFVGYYYLQDRVDSSFNQSLVADSNFYYVNRPQNLLIDALPIEPLTKSAQTSGFLYFMIDLYAVDKFSLKVFWPDNDLVTPFVEFPFVVKH